MCVGGGEEGGCIFFIFNYRVLGKHLRKWL